MATAICEDVRAATDPNISTLHFEIDEERLIEDVAVDRVPAAGAA